MKKVFVTFLICFINTCFAENTSAIYGYVKGEYFHPMLSIKDNKILITSGININTPAQIKPIFEDNAIVINLSVPENYNEALGVEGGGTRSKLIQPLNLDGQQPAPFLFFQSINYPSITRYNNESINMSFYHYFSKDDWGQHFVNKALLVKPSKEIGNETDVNIHGLTDLDSDGKKEIWVSYKLRYGEIGVMLYEQSNGDTWDLLINHCYWCD
ncbi:hypothetical protein [Psychromonas algicola]|uniref:hypothetical protein n=1 Tax=Psychromonas algicola TaxID=2555642 RepID=UPI0010677976|nr:hypothetical protein [Psychromonas sp. RZ5]TEW50153.1 hypothetical protein E2R67_09820 [Psychromonas sp. RZ5]